MRPPLHHMCVEASPNSAGASPCRAHVQGSGFVRSKELSVRFATTLPSSVVAVVPATFVDATTISASPLQP